MDRNIAEREQFYHNSCVHEGFISAVILLNDLMKILVGLVYSILLFLKSLGLIVIAKIVFLSEQINISWF